MTMMTHGLPFTLVLAAGVAPGHRASAPREIAQDSVARGDSTGKHKHGARKAGDGHKWISYDAASHTVTFKLVAGSRRAKTRFNFNGYTDGTATLVIPPKTAVVFNFVNADSLPHSAAVIADGGPIPTTIERPAIGDAATKSLTRGLPRHATEVVRFTAPANGSFRIVSGVAGDGRSGMWIRLRVDPAAKAPSWLKHT
jgi:hypothetical protein